MYASKALNLYCPEEIFREYKYLDASKYMFNVDSLMIIGRYDLRTLFRFFDMFEDINQRENGNGYTMKMNCICIAKLYDNPATMFKIVDYLVNRGVPLSDLHNTFDVFPKTQVINNIVASYHIICGIKKLVNDDEYILTNIDDNLINCMRTMILISKTRTIPKFVVTHKILYYYLSLFMVAN